MPVTSDIAATYRRPGTVVAEHLARGVSEPRALAFLFGACVLMFIAQWPGIARNAHLSNPDFVGNADTGLQAALAGALFSTVMILPLILYGVAALTQAFAWVIRRPIDGYAARLALFWALLASSPLALLNGLVEGFIGVGLELTLVGALWFGAFLWFWISGLRAARAAEEAA